MEFPAKGVRRQTYVSTIHRTHVHAGGKDGNKGSPELNTKISKRMKELDSLPESHVGTVRKAFSEC